MAGAPEGMITFKASKQRPDGGWTHMEISLPPGAEEEQIKAACIQWDAMERISMEKLNEIIQWHVDQAHAQAEQRRQAAQARKQQGQQ